MITITTGGTSYPIINYEMYNKLLGDDGKHYLNFIKCKNNDMI